ncbi:MAG TPA: hypothetical protein ENH33_07745, partial [Actinobacteria bacterium]|nr:hypothetical protein [Actinomycetota bacterium]
GKTAVMAVISQLAAMTGTPILGAVLAGRTAAGLQAATGIPSVTLTRLIGENRDGGLPDGAILVVDEAAMVGTCQLAAVTDLVEQAQGKLILIGDDRQLPEIEAGGLFRALVNRLPAAELTENVRQHEMWERVALTQLRNGSVDQAINAYQQHRRLIIGQDRDNTITRAVDDWYRYVAATGDLTSGLLIAYDNDTVTELNQRARTHLAASNRLHGPALETGERVFQAGDRILCRQNQSRLGILNGDLGIVVSVDPDHGTLDVQLDRDPERRDLPVWYLDQGHVDYGYAMTGHKAQGVTTDRTFTVIEGATDREWVYVAMSRGRQTNTLYLTNPQPANEQCTHLTHPDWKGDLDTLAMSLEHSRAQTAVIDHLARPPSSSTDVLEPAARGQAEHSEPDPRSPGIQLAAGS